MTTYTLGNIVKFKAYTGEEPGTLLKKGDKCSIVEDNGADGFGVVRLRDLAKYQADPNDESVELETLFPDEFSLVEEGGPVAKKKTGVPKNPAKPAKVEEAPAPAPVKAEKAKPAPVKKAAKPAPAPKVDAKPAPAKGRAKLPATEEVAEVPALVITSDIKAALRGKSAVEAARALTVKGKVNDLTLGGILCKIDRDGDHTHIMGEDGEALYTGKEGFHAFIEQDLGIAYRKARYLMANYETVSSLGIDFTRAAGIGYAKLAEVAPLLKAAEGDEETIESWLETAEGSTMEELKAEAKKGKVDAGIEAKPRGNTAEFEKLTFRFFNDKADAVRQALETAKAALEEGADDNDALYHIIEEWVAAQ